MLNEWLYSDVVAGYQRVAIVKALDEIRTPSQIRKKVKQINPKLSLNYTSDVLRHLKKQKIVVCLNEEAKVGRLYKLTKEGEEIRKKLVRVEMMKE